MENKVLRVMALLLVAALLATVMVIPPAGADNLGDLYEDWEQTVKERQQQEKYKKMLEAELGGILAELEQLEYDLHLAQQRLNKLTSQIAVLEEKIAHQEQLIAEKEAEIAEAEEQLETNLDYLEGRLHWMYFNGTVSYLEVLLSATSFTDFVSRFSFLRQIVQSDAELVNEIREIRDWLEAERVELDNVRQELVANRDELEEARQEAAAKEQQVREMVASQRQLLAQAERDMAQLASLIEELIEQEERIYTAIEQERILAGDAPAIFRWPTPIYTRVTSPYGYREFWYWDSAKQRYVLYSDFHRGIDIGIPWDYRPGNPNYPAHIVAAAPGTVSEARYWGSYGYAVEIQHGGGVATRYAHMHEPPLVKVGDFVNSGDVIGYVGSSGFSTGPHLHFEILVFNTSTNKFDTTDPEKYEYIGR